MKNVVLSIAINRYINSLKLLLGARLLLLARLRWWSNTVNMMGKPQGGGGALPHGPTPYHFIYHFSRKDTPSVYLPLTNGTPFVYVPVITYVFEIFK